MSKKQEAMPQMSPKVVFGLMISAGLLIFIASGWLWWHEVYTKPQNVFRNMLNNSLQTRGVTRHVEQDGTNGKLDQYIQINLGVAKVAHSRTNLNQSNEAGNSTVITESIGTPSADYIRYESINTDVKNTEGKARNFESIKNIWGKSDTTSKSSSNAAQLFTETVLGIVPLGNVSTADRQKILNLIRDKNVYQPDYTKVQRRANDLTYDVQINPAGFIEMLQVFVKALGLDPVASLNPSLYEGQPNTQLQITVNRLSHQLVKIDYKEGSEHLETYSGYGLQPKVDLPTKTISIDELQTRLQSVQ